MQKETTEVKTFFSRCRCCLEYGYLKNMWMEYTYRGEPEVYGEMFLQCFSLHWEHTQDTVDQDQICEQCIQRLRDACEFKNTVLKSQEELIKGEVIKEEYLDEDLSSDGTQDFAYNEEALSSMEGSEAGDVTDSKVKQDFDYEVEFLEDDEDSKALFSGATGSKHEVPRRRRQRRPKEGTGSKWPKKLPKDERCITYKQYTEENLRKSLEAARSGAMTVSQAAAEFGVPAKTVRYKLNSDQEVSEKREETFQLIQEIKIILSHTNATPFKTFTNRYYCFYCLDGNVFESAEHLREHTLTHTQDRLTKIEYSLRPQWMHEVVRLDIHNLLCNTCCFPLLTWPDMFQHLINDHDMQFTVAYSKIIPYVLKHEVQCAICDKTFSNIMLLDSHMNSHYNNYVCGDCGDTFITKHRLKIHSKVHTAESYPCPDCPKVFTLDKNRRRHIEVVHNRLSSCQCHYCAEKFLGDKARNEHVLEAHPEKVQHLRCEMCERRFTRRRDYTNHVNKAHSSKMLECKKCHSVFTTRRELNNHMGSEHRSERLLFECVTCKKRYTTIASFERHAKVHKKS